MKRGVELMPKNTTLINLARYDRGILQKDVFLTDEGFIKGRSIVTRCGVFLYKNADGTIRKELRHPDEVLQQESLDSIKMIPIVDDHPPEKIVTSENAKRLSIGYTGECVEVDEPYIISNLVITDKGIVEKIKKKLKNELSLGYTVDLEESPGVYNGEPYDFIQKNIRYNHLALVDEARAGPQAKIVLDSNDAILVTQKEAKLMASQKKLKKVKIDAQEYLMEDGTAEAVEKMIAEKDHLLKMKDELEGKIEELENMLDKANAENDTLRDKEAENPQSEHEPLEYGEEGEEDEIGSEGKEMKSPSDSYGMQSHVKDYEPPVNMENHAVTEPKNKHYPKDLPHIAKVDAAEVRKMVKERVRLEKVADKYLPQDFKHRIDSMSDLEIKKNIILSFQKNAKLEGKNEVYINARFDSVMENLPKEKVIAHPARFDAQSDKENVSSDEARKRMIQNQKNAWNARSK